MTTTVTAAALRAIHLTSVPALHPVFAAPGFDWKDQALVHRCVMSLFDEQLPGPHDRRRSSSSILYRVELGTTGPRVLVQSAVAPKIHAHGVEMTTLAGLSSWICPGQGVRLRIDVNAVRCKSRSGRRIPVPLDEIESFLLTPGDHERSGLLGGAVERLELSDVTIEVLAAGTTPLRIARVFGRATVADPDTLTSKIVNGVGRGKAYGCGLLSVMPE